MKSMGIGQGYGSISVPNEEPQDDQSNDLRRPKTSSAALWLGVMALASVCFLWVSKPSSSDSSPPSGPQNLEVLGKVHRDPADTPHVFSQKVDHFDPHNYETYQERYYRKSEFWKGPGHPIFLVVGGEGALDNGMFYPFVDTYLAKKFGAYVLHPEHRFYGQSQPVDPIMITNEDLKKYHTAHQAMADHIALVQSYQKLLGCSMKKTSKKYCPVISVGGSYPGFLSAVMRLHFSEVIDIGYASSAPLLLYAMEADQFGYMDKVTNVTELASPGCAEAVRTTLAEVHDAILQADNFAQFAYDNLNVCPGTIPSYIDSNKVFSEEAMMIIEYTFADWNMDYYPPDKDTGLYKICKNVFQNDGMDSFQKISEFWYHLEDNVSPTLPCFDMSSQLPDGPRATISGSDWSGVGPGYDGYSFDFHCCSTLTPAVGFSKESMFPYRKWTLEWLTDHCMSRFNVKPDPLRLVKEFKFDDLVGQGASRILFTNGLHDIWSMGSYLESLSDTILSINMENGAHHSELTYMNSDGIDTEDVMEAHDEITKVLKGWLKEIYDDMKH